MKRFFLAVAILFSCFFAFSQETRTITQSIYDIEDIKLAITKSDSQELRLALQDEYNSLESTTFTESSLNQHIFISIGEYNTKTQSWPIKITSLFFGTDKLFTYQTELTYAQVMSRRFTDIQNMTEKQLSDYEENVSEYDEILKKNPNTLFAELYFKVYRWENSSEYCFVPFMLTVANSRLKNKIIYTKDFSSLSKTYARTFKTSPEIEVRSKEEQNNDKKRTAYILNSTESAEKSAEDLSKESESSKETKNNFTVQRARQGIFIMANPEVSTSTTANAQADFCFGLGKFYFIGFDAGLNWFTNTYYFGGFNGFNVRLGKHITPFVKASVSVRTDSNFDIALGGGTDLNLGGLSFTIGYNYTWRYDFSSIYASNFSELVTNVREAKPYSVNSFYLGLGLNW